jgi:hypothetical protein
MTDIRRNKIYTIMADFGIPDKLIRLTKATMENSTQYIKIWTIMTDGFKVGTGLKQGDGLAPNLFKYSTGIRNKATVGTNHINNIL